MTNGLGVLGWAQESLGLSGYHTEGVINDAMDVLDDSLNVGGRACGSRQERERDSRWTTWRCLRGRRRRRRFSSYGRYPMRGLLM